MTTKVLLAAVLVAVLGFFGNAAVAAEETARGVTKKPMVISVGGLLAPQMIARYGSTQAPGMQMAPDPPAMLAVLATSVIFHQVGAQDLPVSFNAIIAKNGRWEILRDDASPYFFVGVSDTAVAPHSGREVVRQAWFQMDLPFSGDVWATNRLLCDELWYKVDRWQYTFDRELFEMFYGSPVPWTCTSGY